ncbi:hypothetical protein [Pseudomonas sp. URMO17WK12:I4]|uniref:hypothetical protein n=1 Tax=Pseudomonas sp. URMO17WK12:I4 TaxID=1283292 RepID=UPI0012DEEA35|nr:hypothetical protein [Pseudomonas sp. URMO17WK12:I4]
MKLLSLDNLLDIENDPVLMEFRCARTGYLLWPLIRTQFFRQLISDLYYRHASLLAPLPPLPYRQLLTVIPKTLLHNFQRGRTTGEVLIFASGGGHFLRGGRWFNRITDYLAEESPSGTVTVEGLVGWHLPEPRWNKSVIYWSPWQVALLLAGRLSVRGEHIRLASELLEHVRRRAKNLHGLDISESKMRMLVGVAARKIARLPATQVAYRRMLERLNPRLLLLEEGCYSDHGVLNHIAHEMGIRVAEPQHGMVSGGHDAYRYAALWRKSELYRSYLPDDFLGYGRWWNDQINAPVRKWVIGHPHYSEQRHSFSGGVEKKDILILGDGIEFQLYLALAQELDSLLPEQYRVVLRPHPLERALVRERFPDSRVGGVVIDCNRDIYEAFGDAYTVAGEVSTGLFEAIGTVPKVLLWETPKARFGYPAHPFACFHDAQEFAEAIMDPVIGRPSVIEEDIWATGWRDNYRNYLEHALA